MKRSYLCITLGLFLILYSSLFAEPLRLNISGIPGEDTDLWTEILSRNPLPRDTVLATAGDASGETPETCTLSIITVPYGSEHNSLPADSVLLAETWYVPAVSLYDSRASVKLEELSTADIDILPLNIIRPPQKALSIEGKYPGDPGYPLTERKFLVLADGIPEKNKGPVLDWMRTIEPITENPEVLWIGCVGDIMVARGVQDILIHRKNGIEQIFSATLPVLKEHDLLLGNLEGAVTRSTEKIQKSYNFKFLPEVLGPLKEAGFNYFSLTNNHCYDYGEKGFTDTLENLRDWGIATSGAGMSLSEAEDFWRYSGKNCNTAILSLGAYPRERNGFNGAETAAAGPEQPGILWAGSAILPFLRERIRKDEFTIIMVHGGYEWQETPAEYQIELYRGIIDAGADMVIGSHPHVLQGIEEYRGRIIAYSLGNFIFPGMDETRYGEDSLILSAGIVSGEIKYLRFFPVKIDNQFLRLDKSGRILERFISLSKSLPRP